MSRKTELRNDCVWFPLGPGGCHFSLERTNEESWDGYFNFFQILELNLWSQPAENREQLLGPVWCICT